MTQRARKRRRRSRRSVRRKVLAALGVVVVLTAAATAGVGAWVLSVAADTPSIDQLKPIDEGANSVVLAADGSRLGYVQSDTIRHPVPNSKVPATLKHATVAIEDEHFYEHAGVDYEAIVRAAVANIKAGGAVQGGSTITQQLVRNLYIAHPEDDLRRKIAEAKLAQEYEDRYSKQEILTKYLNTASYGTTDGRTAVGVEAAAQTYFDRPASKLTLPQSALVAGLPQAPSEYNPLLNPKAALERRNEVLQAMEQEGYIGESQYLSALRQDLGLDRGYKYQQVREPYFFDYVTQDLIDRYGVNTVRNGGLEVHTTIDPRLQQYARSAIASHDYGGPARALVSIDATNGHILAMASSQPYSPGSQFNLAANGHRQPGSSFKPYVLAAAVKQGMNPDSAYYSGKSPVTLELDDGTEWTVHNAESGGGGVMNVRAATVESVNAIYAQLDLDVGPEAVKETAESMGVTSPLDGIPAEGIGGLRVGVTPLEMANAYATLADGGVHHPATAITKVVFPNGKADTPEQGESSRAFSDGIAYEVTDVLKGVLVEGTASGQGIGCPAAGKTGTTDDYTDAWFVGYTPRLSTAVWVGYPDSRTTMGSGAFGGTYAAPIWHDFMAAAHGSYCGDFPEPQNPVDFTSWSGPHEASSSRSRYSYGQPPGGAPQPYVPPAGSTTGQYPPQYYAPGAGQGPAPAPSPAGGGGDEADGPQGGGPGGASPGNSGSGGGGGGPP